MNPSVADERHEQGCADLRTYSGLGWLHFDTVIPVFVVLPTILHYLALPVRPVPERVEDCIDDSRREAEIEEDQLGVLP